MFYGAAFESALTSIALVYNARYRFTLDERPEQLLVSFHIMDHAQESSPDAFTGNVIVHLRSTHSVPIIVMLSVFTHSSISDFLSDSQICMILPLFASAFGSSLYQ